MLIKFFFFFFFLRISWGVTLVFVYKRIIWAIPLMVTLYTPRVIIYYVTVALWLCLSDGRIRMNELDYVVPKCNR